MLLKKVQNFQSSKKKNNTNQQKHKKITTNPNGPTLLVWLRCLFALRLAGWIGLGIGKIRMGSDCFEFSDFRRKPFWAGAWWKYECGNGPFPQISFYSQTLRFVKSDKNKISHHTESMAIYPYGAVATENFPDLFSVFILTLLDDAVTEIFPVICFPLTSSWHRTVTTASHSRTDNPARWKSEIINKVSSEI